MGLSFKVCGVKEKGAMAITCTPSLKLLTSMLRERADLAVLRSSEERGACRMAVVPDVIGQAEADAAAALIAAGLILGSVTSANNATIAAGKVCGAGPAAGTTVADGSPVDLQVSSGPAQVTVPDLIGRSEADAKAALLAAGLTLGAVTPEDRATVPAGSICAMNPAPGTTVSNGTTVQLSVSRRPAELVAVPEVTGFTKAAAETMLKSVGLAAGKVTKLKGGFISAGGVSATSPATGAKLTKGSTVDMEVSSGGERDWNFIVFTVIGVVFLAFLGRMIWVSDGFLASISETKVARGLITFLIAGTTVGIAVILALSTIMLSESQELDRRFDRGKQILTMMIGILGTIVGFYFGQETRVQQAAEPVAITTTALPPGVVNSPYAPTVLQAKGGTPPLKWKATNLPQGLVLDEASGTVSGTPRAAASNAVKLTVTDSATPASTKAIELTLDVKSQ